MKECPICKQMTMQDEDVRNSLSRKDNDTYICNRCGTEEALDDLNEEAQGVVVKWLKQANLIDTNDFD